MPRVKCGKAYKRKFRRGTKKARAIFKKDMLYCKKKRSRRRRRRK